MCSTTASPDSDSEWKDGKEFVPKNVPFTEHTGVNPDIDTANFNALDFVQLFITNELLNLLVQQTNLYAEHFFEDNPDYLRAKPKSRVHRWKPVTLEEIKVFLGIVFLMGLDQKPEMGLHWSTNKLFYSPVYGKTMARDRFFILLKFLHFNNNREMPRPDSAEYDRLYKIRPVITMLQEKFEQVNKKHLVNGVTTVCLL